MLRPRSTGGRLTTGARKTLGGGSAKRIRQLGPTVHLLLAEPRVRRVFHELRCDEQATAFCVCELIDHLGAEATAMLAAGGGQ